MSSWSAFVERSRQKYGFDMSTLDQAYRQECVDYFVLTSMWRELDHRQVLGKPVVVKGKKATEVLNATTVTGVGILEGPADTFLGDGER